MNNQIDLEIIANEKIKVFHYDSSDKEYYQDEINRFVKSHKVSHITQSEAHNWQGAEYFVVIKYRI